MTIPNWTRHAEGWIDNTTGLLWHFESKNGLNWEEAKAWAEEQRGRLPTREELKVAEKNGVRKLDGLDWRYWFWSSTPNGDVDAYVFSGSSGDAYYDVYRDYRDSGVFARCVSAAPGVKPLIPNSSLAERILRAKVLLKEALELLDIAEDA